MKDHKTIKVKVKVKTNIDDLIHKAERLKEILEEAKTIETELASSKILIESAEVER